MRRSKVQVELLEYSVFGDDQTKAWRPIGVAELMVEHKLSKHLIKWHYCALEAHSDYSPDIDKFDPFKDFSEDYNLRVLGFVEKLADYGLVNESFECELVCFGPYFSCVAPWNWTGGEHLRLAEALAKVGSKDKEELVSNLCYSFAEFLEDLYFDVAIYREPFSRKWYMLKAATLYFDRAPINSLGEADLANSAFTIGSLLAEMRWKFQHEDMALLGRENSLALSRARQVKASQIESKRTSKNTILADLWFRVKREKGSAAVRYDINAARHIGDYISDGSVPELVVKATGKPWSEDTIRKRISLLRTEGKLE